MNKPRETASVQQNSAGILRRLGALLYDAFLVVPLMMLVTFLFIWPLGGAPDTPALKHILFFLLLAAIIAFYSWFWTHGGQTLGMRAWRLKAVALDGSPMPFPMCLVRCLTAAPALLLFAAGYIWILVDPDKLALHDRLSKSRVVVLEKNKMKKKAG